MTATPSIAVLSARAVLSVAGPEARRFLHNVVTADIEALNDGEARYSALLTPQGKILFDFFILADGERFLIDCAAGGAASLLQRLTLYRLRANVELKRQEDLAVAAAWDGEVEGEGVVTYADPRVEGFGWRLIAAPQVLSRMANADQAAYDARRIATGLADAVDIGSAEVFPHEANLDQLGGLSFSKGCYVGQEVVSRMQHRGTARSRMVPVGIDGEAGPGIAVTAGDRPIGMLLSVAGKDGLALIRLDRAETARQNGVAIMAGTAHLHLRHPTWAHWKVVADKDE